MFESRRPALYSDRHPLALLQQNKSKKCRRKQNNAQERQQLSTVFALHHSSYGHPDLIRDLILVPLFTSDGAADLLVHNAQ